MWQVSEITPRPMTRTSGHGSTNGCGRAAQLISVSTELCYTPPSCRNLSSKIRASSCRSTSKGSAISKQYPAAYQPWAVAACSEEMWPSNSIAVGLRIRAISACLHKTAKSRESAPLRPRYDAHRCAWAHFERTRPWPDLFEGFFKYL